MPDNEFPKLRPHPFKAPPTRSQLPMGATLFTPPAAELCARSNYSFLRAASHPEELVERAAALGYRALGICDEHSLAGIVRAHVAARQHNVRLVVGSRIVPTDLAGDMAGNLAGDQQVELCLLPTSLPAYRRLCRLLTLGKRRAPKGGCELTLEDVRAHAQGMHAVVLGCAAGLPALDAVRRAADVLDAGCCSLGVALLREGDDDDHLLERAQDLGQRAGVPLLATNSPLYHDASRRMLQDVLTCVRGLPAPDGQRVPTTLAQAGMALRPNAQRHLRHPAELARLFARCPRAMARALEVASACEGFSLDMLRYEYPDEVVPEGRLPDEWLAELALRGARERYPAGIPDKVSAQIRHELGLIAQLGYAKYFLTVHDIVRFARERGILCQGRGAAANSAVCYCLGVTAVDPDRVSVLFERFVSKERNEPPDIDIDFEHERREEVIQYLYAKYGRERAALTGVVISYRRRSAIRDVGKALGLSLDVVDKLAKDVAWWDEGALRPAGVRALGLDPADATLRHLARLTGEVLGFPRHLSQHVGGFVITREPLCEMVPIENAAMEDRTVIEWDKDDVDAMGMLKVDVLGLGMLTCIRKAMELVNAHAPDGRPDARPLALHTIPPEDPRVYDMLCAADTVGVFQIESRAQMSMLPRLRPRCYYDLVIEVAIVRPGPIQGDMVHPYLRRRNGEEPVEYVHPAVRTVLERTLGVPLFQEQCMALAVEAAGFSPGQADQLRRAMAAWKRRGTLIYEMGQRLMDGMIARGIPADFAQRCFDQIKGFSEYGFPESHAASFALLVYASAWLKRHHPAAFAAALLNSQPMGFYAPAQIVRDAQAHGVRVLPVDVHRSAWDCTLEPDPHAPGALALRLGMRMVKGLSPQHARRIEDAARTRAGEPFPHALALWRTADVPVAALRRLARADALRSLGEGGLSRQRALWQLHALRDEPLPLFDACPPAEAPDPSVALPAIAPRTQVFEDYASVGLSLRAHPMSFVRFGLARRGVRPCEQLRDELACPHASRAAVAGLVLVRQRPGTASGVVFITLEDETGVANLIVRPRVYERFRRAAHASVALLAFGRVERSGEVVHLLVRRIESLDRELADVPGTRARNFH